MIHHGETLYPSEGIFTAIFDKQQHALDRRCVEIVEASITSCLSYSRGLRRVRVHCVVRQSEPRCPAFDSRSRCHEEVLAGT